MRAEGRHCPCILIPEALFTITKLQQSRAGKTCKMNSPKILIFKVKMLRLLKVSPTHKASWPSEISATPQDHVSRCPILGKRKQEHTTSLWSLRIPQCISMWYYFRRSFTRWDVTTQAFPSARKVKFRCARSPVQEMTNCT